MNAPSDIRLARALRRVQVRFATDAEGPLVGELVKTAGHVVGGCDWSRVYPHWLVAISRGKFAGCLQICYGIPVARLELLAFAQGTSFQVRCLAVKALLSLGALTAKKAGASMVTGCIPAAQQHFKDLLKHEGCQVLYSGNMMGKAV